MAGCAGGDSCVEQPADFADCPVSGTCYLAEVANPFGSGTSVSRNATPVSVPANVYALDIACSAAKSCVMAGLFGSITATVNGKTFRTEHSPVKVTLYGITCPSTRVCYVVGAHGAILRGGLLPAYLAWAAFRHIADRACCANVSERCRCVRNWAHST